MAARPDPGTRIVTAHLVVLAGLPGAGKTTVASWLRDEQGYTIASRDTIRAAMFPRCRFTLAEKAAAFEAMKRSIGLMLELDMPVVTDGICFSSRAELAEVVALGDAAGAPVHVLECRVPVSVAQERVEFDRRNDPTVPADRDTALVAAVQERFDPLPNWATVIDGTAGVERVREAVTRALAVEAPRS